MDTILRDLEAGHRLGSGPRLAAALTPVDTPEHPDRLKSFYYFSNAAQLPASLRYYISQLNGEKIPKQDLNAWVDIFSAYWKAVGEIVKFDEFASRASWANVFDNWKDLANVLIRAYTNPGLETWTIPCLYVVGKYLRVFASKADAESSSQGSVEFSEDDMVTDCLPCVSMTGETKSCLGTFPSLTKYCRAPKEESRKWGVYYMSNLLFKTYFKV